MFRSLTFLFILFASNNLYGQSAGGLSSISKLFNAKAYTKVLFSLKNYRPKSKEAQSEKYYFKGISQARLEQFDPAVKSLVKSIKLGSKRADIFYETGQAFYANNDLSLARKYFLKSSDKGFKASISLYYAAYSSQILEEYKKAKAYYARMLKQKDSTTEFKQIAHYQLAEVLLELAIKKGNVKKLVKKHILPRYDIALKVDPKSKLAKDIKTRKLVIIKRYRLDPSQLISGKTLPKKRHRLTVSQSYRYDNNITLTTNQPSVQDTKKDSFIYETNAGASYAFLFKQMYIITPSLKLKYKRHSDRESPEVYEDDSYSIRPSLKQRLDHKVFNKAGSFTLDYTYTYTARDAYRLKELKKYSTGSTWSIGEKIGFFNFGDTGLSYSSGNTSYENDILNFDLSGWTVTQTVIRPSGSLFLLMYNTSSSVFPKSNTSDSNTTMLRVDYILPKLSKQFSFHFGFSVTWLDVINSGALKKDITYAPSMKLTKAVRKNVKVSVNYNYSKKVSGVVETSDYSKHVTGFEISASF